MAEARQPEICDYEGSEYRTDFWEGRGRDYEDRVERIALRRLLPPSGERLLELGAGYGRLSRLFTGYQQVVLLDYSRSQLEYAHRCYGEASFLYVAADLYNMPFAPGVFDGATMVRVLHHMQDPPAALRSVRRVMRQGGTFVLEYANKQNLKAIARWALQRQAWNPFSREPVEFVELNYAFHPAYVTDVLGQVGFAPGRTLTVSHYRVGALKRAVPTPLLAALDSMAQFTGGWWQLTPSVFVRNEAVGEEQMAPPGAFWMCPECGSYEVVQSGERLQCQDCGTRWAKRNGVWDFKEPLDG
mgnify:CR=1 FL=1